MHIINHKQACGLMVFPDGIGLGIGGCFWAVFAQGAKVCDNRGLRSKNCEWLKHRVTTCRMVVVPVWGPKELS